MIDFGRENLARVVEIKEVIDHPNADRLDIVTIDEWQCVSKKGTFKAGDTAVYFEIDSILPKEVESKIFGKDSKVKLKNSRVRTIKLRKAISQGLAVPQEVMFENKRYSVGKDVTKKLGIGKYVPTPKKGSVLYTGSARSAGVGNENFTKMRKPSHHKTVGGFPGKQVMITEKIHGTSFVAGWVEREGRTFEQKIVKFLFGKYEFCWRSMNRQLQPKDSLWRNIKKKFGFVNDAAAMEETLYGRIARNYSLKDVLFDGQVVTGEIYGPGVQDGYAYGEDTQKLVAFGFREDGKECSPDDIAKNLNEKQIPMVPILYIGEYDVNIVNECTVGKSILDPETKVREGCCVVTMDGENEWYGKCIVKNINPEYLLKDQSEFN